ncbi:patatin-like phospholipase family protein [Roseomonas sp. HJA6]|uniref:Patatin-like phospholipase family protein n=1 Tax=Roseomonas alba TaxID=2846776 RepID=A0ABS7A6T9_9PROT|nr:patatin-like phospholipase family protein [Neoroseomonas alba]MBW6398013.1 patatin-like phospholipase family protein [Neoroseomonas alba]
MAAHRRSFLALGGTGLLASCALPVRGPAVPRGRMTEATVIGLPNERFSLFSRAGLQGLEAEFQAAAERMRQRLNLGPTAPLPPVNLLAISGGGENGAFGAGLLCGWTEAGNRPEFNLVTGVSTGALTAPFAFLGSAYDAQLRSVYTQLTLAEVARSRGLLQAVFADGLADNTPLFHTISRYMTAEMLAAIAEAYRGGRLMLIGTTQLDAQLPVIWNMGAIAASGHPRALDLARRILLASAAIPGAFSPVMIDVTLDGEARQEMHVDGGAFAQAFLYPASLGAGRQQRIRRGTAARDVEAYVIRNARLDPDWADVERRTLGIAGRAIATMIAASGYNDVLRIYANTQRDGIGFHLAFIGTDFDMELPAPFDQGYMRALFDYGFQRARRGYPWASRPPV